MALNILTSASSSLAVSARFVAFCTTLSLLAALEETVFALNVLLGLYGIAAEVARQVDSLKDQVGSACGHLLDSVVE
jgi:Ca2+/H+ antiporter